VRPEEFPVFVVGDELDEADWFAESVCLAVGGEGLMVGGDH